MAIKRNNGVWMFSLALISLTSMASAGRFDFGVSSTTFQDSIFCLSGDTATPLPGARARIECRSPGRKPAFTIISGPANSNGFYKASASGVKLVGCKAFLESSPSWGCRFATDINGGRSGSPVIPFSVFGEFYSCKPLFFAPN